ncbi:MAG: hypothetical protein ACJA2E_002178 [Arenicella sp.]|jgi:hypothetical protein
MIGAAGAVHSANALLLSPNANEHAIKVLENRFMMPPSAGIFMVSKVTSQHIVSRRYNV